MTTAILIIIHLYIYCRSFSLVALPRRRYYAVNASDGILYYYKCVCTYLCLSDKAISLGLRAGSTILIRIQCVHMQYRHTNNRI